MARTRSAMLSNERWERLVDTLIKHGVYKGRGSLPLHAQDVAVRDAFALSYSMKCSMESVIQQAKAEAASRMAVKA